MRPYSKGCYTLPSGRSATKREYEERMKLLEERKTCPECKKIQEKQGWDERVNFCNRHQSV